MNQSISRATPRRWVPLAALVVICGLPMIGAWVLYVDHDLLPKGRTNFGQLIEPGFPVGELHLAAVAGRQFRVEQLQGRWTLFWVTSRDCAEACGATLLLLRNLRTALREDAARLQSFAIPLAGAGRGWAGRADETSGVVVLNGSAQSLRELAERFAAGANVDPTRPDGFYLADPSGRVIMRYGPDADLQSILGDLQRLLKFTWTGR